LTEAAYLLGTPEPLLQMLVDGDLMADFDAEAHAADLLRWVEKFADLDPGFADACVVKLGELHPRAEILTTDRRDFSAYRTLAGKPLRCVFPT
jgi:predicted nucleic acid-binding protein